MTYFSKPYYCSPLHPGLLVDNQDVFECKSRPGSTARSLRTYIMYLSSCSVADPDPLDPYDFGPPGSASVSISQKIPYVSGSGSFHHQAKIVRKTLILTVLWLLSLKNDVNGPSKSYKQKNVEKIFLLTSWRSLTKIAGSISQRVWIRGSISNPSFHGSATNEQLYKCKY
jgi:hypothetical protein